MSDIAPLVFILRDEQRYQVFSWLCEQAGVPHMRAEGGLHALTQLERSRASAIICEARLPDMRAGELWAIMRSDPATEQLPFFLLAGRAPSNFTAAADHLLGHGVCTPLVLASVLQQLGVGVARPPLLSGAPPELYCSARTFSLPELINWLSEARKTGHWVIQLKNASGYLIMREGDLVYGEFLDELGQGALLAMMLETGQEGRKEVSFYAAQIPPGYPRNINMTTRQLLVAVSVSLDHLNAKIIG